MAITYNRSPYWASQCHFNSLHYLMATGSRTRSWYVDQVNSSWSAIDPKYKPGLQRRKDHRTLGRFAMEIHDATVREKFLLEEWRKSVGREFTIADYATGNDGRLILDQDSMEGRPDYWVTSPRGEWKLEVKFSPCLWKMTYKIADLKSYARDDALVLLIMGNSMMIGPNGDPNSERPLEVPAGLRWCLFGRQTIRKMLSGIPHKLHREVGHKPSIQLKDAEIRRFLRIRDW